MDIKKIEALKKRVDTLNQQIVEKRTQLKMRKEQFQQKLNELEELGVVGVKAAKDNFIEIVEAHISESDKSCEVLTAKIEKAVSHAESQLGTSDEIF